jgi:hypothetical protein
MKKIRYYMIVAENPGGGCGCHTGPAELYAEQVEPLYVNEEEYEGILFTNRQEALDAIKSARASMKEDTDGRWEGLRLKVKRCNAEDWDTDIEKKMYQKPTPRQLVSLKAWKTRRDKAWDAMVAARKA